MSRPFSVIARLTTSTDASASTAALLTHTQRTVQLAEKPGATPRSFTFHDVYTDSDLTTLYTSHCSSQLDAVWNGCECVVAVCGSESSGKTQTIFTLQDSTQGLIDLALQALFDKVQSAKQTTQSLITLSAFAVSNNSSSIIDLLLPDTTTSLNVSQSSRGMVIEKLSAVVVEDAAACQAYVFQCQAVAAALSSRSSAAAQLDGALHTVIQMNVDVIEETSSNVTRQGKWQFIRCCTPPLRSEKKDVNAWGIFTATLEDLTHSEETKREYVESFSVQQRLSSHPWTRLLLPALTGTAHALFVACLPQHYTPSSYQVCSIIEPLLNYQPPLTVKVQKSTVGTTLRELREQIRVLRGKLNLAQPGMAFLSDLDPQQLTTLQQLLSELERVKLNTWLKKREDSNRVIGLRKERLEREGLSHTLIEPSVIIPTALQHQHKSQLNTIVNANLILEETEAEFETARNKHRIRLEQYNKKLLSNPELQKDEKLLATEKELSEVRDKVSGQQRELKDIEEAYKTTLHKIMSIEAKQRRLYITAQDLQSLERLNKSHEFSTIKQSMNDDPEFSNMIQSLQANSQQYIDTFQQRLEQVASETPSAQSLKEETHKLLEDWRQQTETVQRITYERDLLWTRMIQQQYRNQVLLQQQQMEMFQIFRNYRAHFEQQKQRIEDKYRVLAENAVKDALKLSEENQRLRQQLNNKFRLIAL